MTAPDQPALMVRDVVRSFDHPAGSARVLDRIDMTVSAGEIVTVAGPSGSGKTALLSILCGFDRPDSGTVTIAGRPVDTRAISCAPSWRDCAVLPQTLGLADELTLAENVALPLLLNGQNGLNRRRDWRWQVDEMLAELGIAALADRYPHQVSFGQQQRAAVARAVIAGPAVLLADEPTAHLDVGGAEAVLSVLRHAAERGAGLVVATHDEQVHRIADRTLALTEGRLVSR
jgi:putative ABC transport system ATP-binding protein